MTIINKTKTLKLPMTVSTSAYADGDVVGGLLDLNELVGAGGGGVIRQVRLVDAANQSEPFYLYLFDEKPTEIADADVFASAITADDRIAECGRVSLPTDDYQVVNSIGKVVAETAISHGNGELWGYLVANGGTPDYAAATDLTLVVTGWKD